MGVSLTINAVRDDPAACVFDVMLVPHTLFRTKLGDLEPGVQVNLEVDVLARYVARQLDCASGESADGRLVAKLKDGGFL